MFLKVLCLVISMLIATSFARYIDLTELRYTPADDYRRSNSLKNWVPFSFRFGINDSVRCKVYVPEDVHGALKRTWTSVTDDEVVSRSNLKTKIKSTLGGLLQSFRSAPKLAADYVSKDHEEH